MRDDVLFSKLARKGATPDRTNVENFFTELLAYVLKSEKSLRRNFLEWVGGLKGEALEEDWKIRTQVKTCSPTRVLDGLYLDLLLQSPAGTIIVENKVDSPASEAQLQNYVGYAKEREANGGQLWRVALLSKEPPPFTGRLDKAYFLGSFNWSRMAERWIPLAEAVTARWLFDEMLKFMRREGMAREDPEVEEETRRLRAIVSRLDPAGDPVLDPALGLRGRDDPLGFVGRVWAPGSGDPHKTAFWYFRGFYELDNFHRDWFRREGDSVDAVVFIGMWSASPGGGQALFDRLEGTCEEFAVLRESPHVKVVRSGTGLFLVLQLPLDRVDGTSETRAVQFLVEGQNIMRGKVAPIYKEYTRP